MKRIHDLSELSWVVSGWAPDAWRQAPATRAEVPPVPASVPGSVQQALKDAGLLPDWTMGLNARACEWVENRHWIYETTLPAGWRLADGCHRLHCAGLDWKGTVFLNDREIGRFEGAFTPHVFELDQALADGENRLRLVFECPPRSLGQAGFTSRVTTWKPRFNYAWDWTPRLVQLGVWDAVTLEVTDGDEIRDLRAWTSMEMRMETGNLNVRGHVGGTRARRVRCVLTQRENVIHEERFSASEFQVGVSFRDIPVRLWWPNGAGAQPVYALRVELLDEAEAVLDAVERRVGFKHVEWRPCEGAPEDADPWLCVVNGKPLHLRGVAWMPIRPHFADVTEADYRKRLELYRDLGVNTIRVWGGTYLEKTCFYDLCDELGLLVWQEFPLSASASDAWPTEQAEAIAQMNAIARSFVARRQHHASLMLWGGGHALQTAPDGRIGGVGRPCGLDHPMLAMLADVVDALDPTRRFVPTSASGPFATAERERFGQGLHWDVHGPWAAPGDLAEWAAYWQGDDALFRSEVAASGASGVDLVEIHAGELQPTPIDAANPYWRRTASWADAEAFKAVTGRAPKDLREFVSWSQQRQAEALSIAAKASAERFPRTGGFVVWFGHDCFPCASSTAIVDYWGRPKPAALALKEIWRGS
jgi:beta-mannosidase